MLAFMDCFGYRRYADAPPGAILSIWRAEKPHPQPRLCPECARADKRQYGYSYWRRGHQILGVDSCQVHGEPLHRCVLPPRTLPLQPSNAQGQAVARQREIDAELGNAALLRYRHIAIALTERTCGLNHRSVIEALSCIAEEQGVRTTLRDKNTPGRYLSDMAMDSLPRTWLDRCFPRLHQKAPGRRSGRIDLMFLAPRASSTRGHHVALALALLLPSVEEASGLLCQIEAI